MGNTPSVCADAQPELFAIWSEALIELPYGLDFIQLVMSINSEYREIGLKATKIRVMRAVTKFLPSPFHEEFFTLMRLQHSVIGGSVAQMILTPKHFGVVSDSQTRCSISLTGLFVQASSKQSEHIRGQEQSCRDD